jgi:hypothetical protein
MVKYIIEADAKLALKRIKKSSRLCLNGNQLVIRKKPHVIDVALGQSILHNCWCITWMAIYTIQTQEI